MAETADNPTAKKYLPDSDDIPDIPPPRGDLWIFGYGSLIWNPGFRHYDAIPARLYGFHRTFCVWSIRYRGTHRKKPGLVLGLDQGGSCRGLAFRVDHHDKDAVLKYLKERELITGVYRPHYARVFLEAGHSAHALCFVVRRDHPQYACNLSPTEAAAIVRRSQGQSGENTEYAINTLVSLEKMGVTDIGLRKFVDLVRTAG